MHKGMALVVYKNTASHYIGGNIPKLRESPVISLILRLLIIIIGSGENSEL